ncbi:MAG: sulfite exporter TauE/SafE family protein [Phycisphaerae bacterium]
MIYLVLPVVALLTATLSAIVGMGGGMLLLATMFCFVSHSEAIPSHAAVQLISNSTRTLAFLRQVDWRTVGRFLIGVVPGSFMGLFLLSWLGEPRGSEPWLKSLVGAYILGSLLAPRTTKQSSASTWWDFPVLGVAAGMAAFTVGAVGPLIAPLFVRRNFVKERLVATKALCQSFIHTAKIPGFLLLRSYENLEALGAVTLAMAVLVVPGTLLGKRVLKDVSEQRFVLFYRLALLAAGLKVLLVDGVVPLLRG